MANQRILLRPLNCLAVFLTLCLTPLCFAESVVVQVLGKNGHPVPQQEVTLEFRSEPLEPPLVRIQRTDLNGETRIPLPLAVKPKTLAVEINFTPNDLRCSCRAHADLETVMHDGLTVITPALDSQPSAVQPTAGHIVFFARPATLSEIRHSGRSSRLKRILFGQ